MKFHVVASDGSARAGVLETDHGTVLTPVFIPVGTQGTVKAVEQRELLEMGAQIILGNTYHLYLRPGVEVIRKAGGLHRFMAWPRPILTDSGGYQVFSLADLRRIEEEGVLFRSHLDGSTHMFTPESVVAIQRQLGSDIMMVLDECAPYPCDRRYAHESNALTVRWAERCKEVFDREGPIHGHSQALFAIVQGGIYPEVRKLSARALLDTGFDGYAVGGLAVGEPVEQMYDIVELCGRLLPQERPRYLMGVGTPEDLLECVERGMDLFDCVLPTRNGRNANVFTRRGPLNLRNAGFKSDMRPVDPECPCYTCSTFSRAYLRHLFQAKEILALQLATIHNLTFYLALMSEMREAIVAHQFATWKRTVLALMGSNQAVPS